MSERIAKDNIAGIECKHIAYQAATDKSLNDIMVAKLVIHTKDGRQVHRVEFIENYKRPFYITQPPYRNHQDKKEYEEIDRLTKYECTQVEMPMKIQMALGRRVPDPKLQLRQVCQSPYVYYADFSSPTYLRSLYRKKWPNTVSRNRVEACDLAPRHTVHRHGFL